MSGGAANAGDEAPPQPGAAPPHAAPRRDGPDAGDDIGRRASGTVIGILGPTGVGKTSVAAALARRLGVRVVSSDSMQIYRDFPVLTNQPGAAETLGVEHLLIGFADPSRGFSAAEYAEQARPLITEDIDRAGWALVAGGSGLYLRAAVAPLAVAPSDPELRARLERRAAAEGADALYQELAQLDPAAAAIVDRQNPRRVVRALEAILVGGAAWSGRDDLWNPRYDRPTLIVGLTLDREVLHARINARAAEMVEQGAVEEVRRFRAQVGKAASSPGGPGIRSAIGYREICGYLDGELRRQETVEQMATATRRYARRQITWLRKVRDAVIIDVQDRDPEHVAGEILDLALAKRNAEESRY